MTPAFYFLLECFAVALVAAVVFSVFSASLFRLLAPALMRLTASRRADALFILSILPAIGTLAIVVGTAAPSILALFGIGHDHCGVHGHHAHLCVIHSLHLRPVIVAFGGMSLGVFVYRAILFASSAVKTRSGLRRLESLGIRREGHFPAFVVPAAMCHATGIVRPRILVSDELEKSLTGSELRAALAHEEAHLLRRDPAVLTCLRLASLFAVPALAQLLSAHFRQAIEEAADARAATSVEDPSLVARALLKVAALQQRSVEAFATLPAFGRSSLERRVRLLLDDSPSAGAKPLALLIGAAGVFASVSVALVHSPALHHAVETALSHF
jgi:Zn-dependent protease with chaperone function